MRKLSGGALGFIGRILLSLGLGTSAHATQESIARGVQKGAPMTARASGMFEVNLNAQPPSEKPEDPSLGRMTIDKQFHGDLEGASKGEMLTATTAVQGSAGYVAIERVSGALRGRKGTFVLQHNGIMTRGAQQLSVTVVPGSGTEQLVGPAGRMTINIADRKHVYDFEYTLPEKP